MLHTAITRDIVAVMQNGLALAGRLAPTVALFRAWVSQPSLACSHRKGVGNLPIANRQRTSGFSQWALDRAPRPCQVPVVMFFARWMEQLCSVRGACHSCSRLRPGAQRARLPCSRPSLLPSWPGCFWLSTRWRAPADRGAAVGGTCLCCKRSVLAARDRPILSTSPSLLRPRSRASRRLPLQRAQRPSKQLHAVIPFTLALPPPLLHLHLRRPAAHQERASSSFLFAPSLSR